MSEFSLDGRTVRSATGRSGGRKRLTSAQRELLYETERLDAIARNLSLFPVCQLCRNPIFPGQRWHENHNEFLPAALGGGPDGISHERCNLDHAYQIDTPLVAKAKRVRQKHIGAWQPRSRIAGGRNDWRKKKFDGRVVDRRTGKLLWGK